MRRARSTTADRVAPGTAAAPPSHSLAPPRSHDRRYLPEAFTNASVAAQAAVAGRPDEAVVRHYLLKVAFAGADPDAEPDIVRYAVHIDAGTDVPAHAVSPRISPAITPLPHVPLFWVTNFDETPEELRPTAFACTVTCTPAAMLTMLAGEAADLSADSFAAMQTCVHRAELPILTPGFLSRRPVLKTHAII